MDPKSKKEWEKLVDLREDESETFGYDPEDSDGGCDYDSGDYDGE